MAGIVKLFFYAPRHVFCQKGQCGIVDLFGNNHNAKLAAGLDGKRLVYTGKAYGYNIAGLILGIIGAIVGVVSVILFFMLLLGVLTPAF